MATSNETVCNIQECVVLRMIFGFYTNIPVSSRVQKIIKLYCYVIPLVLFGARFYCEHRTFVIVSLEYVLFLFFYFFSFRTENDYITQFFTYDCLVDGLPYSRRMFLLLRKIITWITITVVGRLVIHYILSNASFLLYGGDNRILENTIIKLFRLATELGRFPLLLIFSLLYCRVKIFCKSLINDGFKHSQSRGLKNKYLHTYISICNNLYKTNYPVKYMVLINVCTNFINTLMLGFFVIARVKQEDTNINILLTFLSILHLIVDYSITYFPALILELVYEEFDKAQKFIADQLVQCTDDARRDEMQLMLMYLRKQPLQYLLCGIVPVRASLPCNALLFIINYLVCYNSQMSSLHSRKCRVLTQQTYKCRSLFKIGSLLGSRVRPG